MRKLALSDEILLQIDKAARYIGGEVNAVMKNKEDVEIRFAMAFPDVYEIGMSNLGMMILYDMFNKRDDVWCERLFSPWTDLDKIMREEKIPLFTLESQDPVREFDFLGITLGYEMCYTNVLQLLDLGGIPLRAAQRREDDPLVIGGGACAYNPEPLAEFFDLFYIGEGETVYDALFDAYKANKKNGGSRQDFLLNRERELSSSEAELYFRTETPETISPLQQEIYRRLKERYPLSVISFSPPETVFEKLFVTGEADIVAEFYARNKEQAPDAPTLQKLEKTLESKTGLAPVGVAFENQLNISIDHQKLLLYNISYEEVYSCLLYTSPSPRD